MAIKVNLKKKSHKNFFNHSIIFFFKLIFIIIFFVKKKTIKTYFNSFMFGILFFTFFWFDFSVKFNYLFF